MTKGKHITDKFLWDVYNFLEKETGSTIYFITRPKRTMRDEFGKPHEIIEKYLKGKTRQQFSKFINYLKRRGYIRIKNLEGKKALMLTKSGIGRALRSSFDEKEYKKRKDGKWIMIIFDIPQNHRKARDLLRSVLRNLGYKMFQQSVWVCPYDVFDKTEKSLQFFSLDQYIKIFLVEEL